MAGAARRRRVRGATHQENRAMTRTPSAIRTLPPAAPPPEVADPGLIRLGAAVGTPVKR